MNTFGLIGFPLSHSFSKKYFTEKFQTNKIENCTYELFPIENAAEMLDLVRSNSSIKGLNVTIPHKVSVLPYLTKLDEAAKEIGAVNCIQFVDNERIGYNTDAYGFEMSLCPLLENHHQKALIFGNGGAAKAVKYVLKKLGIDFLVVGRNPEQGCMLYEEITANILSNYTILINTTPLGMMPNENTCPPISYSDLSEKHLAYDLVYNPLETLFLTQAKAQGAKTKNGLEMLHLQAERSWEIWNTTL
ncbi:MAG: shikimate dehydrogenase [Sphingobacteriaceae bacterium]|nr:shikimate dehydrogenase [Sphingobacteriaceae bacterium]